MWPKHNEWFQKNVKSVHCCSLICTSWLVEGNQGVGDEQLQETVTSSPEQGDEQLQETVTSPVQYNLSLK